MSRGLQGRAPAGTLGKIRCVSWSWWWPPVFRAPWPASDSVTRPSPGVSVSSRGVFLMKDTSPVG